jgi:hypothetical protein
MIVQEVVVLALATAAAALFVALGSPLVLGTAGAAYKAAEYRALYVLPTVHVADGDVWLCFNSTRTPAAAYNATDGRPLKIHNDCYMGPGRSCTPRKTPKHTLYCRAWIGSLKPGDRIAYVVQGERAERTVVIELNSISVPQNR